MEFYERLFQALKKDNLKEFRSCMETSNCGALRLGRFPVLSVMYLYNARKLLYAYEKKFLKHNSWQDIGEPMELSVKFRNVAGKCLRFYLNETVSPVEMLLLLNKDAKLRRVFSQAHITAPVKQRLKDIYFVKWGLKAEFVRNKIVLERRPMTRAEKLRWLTSTLCVVLCVALVVGTPFVINTFSPFITDGSGAISVSRWEQIKFDTHKTYALTSNVTVPTNFFVEEMNCELRGNDHTVTVQGDGVFGNINGKLSDIVFNTNGSAVAETVTLQAVVERVTVNAVVDMQTDEAIGFFANDNFGTISNVTVNASGTLAAVTPEQTTTPSFKCGGVVANNSTTKIGNNIYGASVLNCVANYDDFTLQGQLHADAAFGGIVGQNDAFVKDCQTNGELSADTLDVAGICAENTHEIEKCVNSASVSQTTDVAGWNPIAAGIVLVNDHGTVDGCRNYGSITCVNDVVAVTDEQVVYAYAAGIVCRSYGDISQSANMGTIYAKSDGEVCVGGIASDSCFETTDCLSVGRIEASGEVCFVGGILGYSFGWYYVHSPLYCGDIERCVSDSEIVVTTKSFNSFVAVGGIVGFVEEWKITYEDSDEIDYMCGEIYSCYFTGELQTTANVYVGAIAGIVGEKVHLAASQENANFYDNKYVNGCGASSSFGALLKRDDDSYEKVSSNVGAQVATAEEIANDATYKKIMQKLNEIM